ncbi:YeeE/YedE thiosulfate transporter family protein [uncultured Tateyamaria sp.]|uniref:YeeE/YedE family protein n=1 Tax=uncultured Tateyamaria sp. TaxID=455651 RepID=UPI00263156EC|nr:YeeE/YedE thiosulfate transporter family protein [uncultured Tateyamaria sp.]
MEIAWLWGLLGGLLIGTGGAVLLLGAGRIMGASGIVGGLVDGSGTHRGATLAFLAGLIGAPALLSLAGWSATTGATSQIWLLILAGLAVGVGTRFANGCTSGHGVCGLSRLSLRGLVATLFYIGAGVITVTVLRIGLGL